MHLGQFEIIIKYCSVVTSAWDLCTENSIDPPRENLRHRHEKNIAASSRNAMPITACYFALPHPPPPPPLVQVSFVSEAILDAQPLTPLHLPRAVDLSCIRRPHPPHPDRITDTGSPCPWQK
ncbi:unnamed protein product [Pleuronectes platessa]|uniref:Uncharacterized protein n=1 Tax=Pleuronectes platessa TaxID=8262 RepID=A0A9N7VA48_PLEPL|nr:unnamed protein product [Pleuronectes platessa]